LSVQAATRQAAVAVKIASLIILSIVDSSPPFWASVRLDETELR
jgi:hypothetical protein